jgi:hypothetical protein
MTAVTGLSEILPEEARRGRAPEGWIASPAFDLLFLMFAPLLTLPVMLGLYLKIPLLAIGGGIALAFSHYLSSTSFYFWDENRAYHRTRWLAFFGGPALLALVYLALLGLRVPYVIQFILFFWNTFHVARQNSGLLSIYRQRAGVTDPGEKGPANRAILATSTFLALWNIETHPEVAALFAAVHPDLARAVKTTAAAAMAVCLLALARSLLRRLRGGRAPGFPEAACLLTSLAFFHPYLFIRNSEIATFAMLLPHYVQYLALVWLLHRRKFGATGQGVPRLLGLMSARLHYLLPMLGLVGFSFYFLQEALRAASLLRVFESLYLLIALEHFYVDGLLWSFRQPHIRQSIGPYLLRRPAAA